MGPENPVFVQHTCWLDAYPNSGLGIDERIGDYKWIVRFPLSPLLLEGVSNALVVNGSKGEIKIPLLSKTDFLVLQNSCQIGYGVSRFQ